MSETPWSEIIGITVVAVLAIAAIGYAKKENMLISPNATTNVRQWPYYYYTIPYRYESGGAWPPGMNNRLSHWYPGYDVTGWSFDMRPGVGYIRWPRNRWVKTDGSHYYINNGGKTDRPADYYQAS